MTRHVVLYLCKAQFSGSSSVSYDQPPAVGALHGCILFVSQTTPIEDFEAARRVLARYGWSEIEMKDSGPFQPESINSQQMAVFQHHYEECLEQGDSLVWYP